MVDIQTEGSADFNFMEGRETGPAIDKKKPERSIFEALMEAEEEEMEEPIQENKPEKVKAKAKTPEKKKGTRKKEVMDILAATAKVAKEEKEAEATTKAIKIATSGSLTPEIIKEARRLAGSSKGLDIAAFVTKYHLMNFNVANVLEGQLDEKGNLI